MNGSPSQFSPDSDPAPPPAGNAWTRLRQALAALCVENPVADALAWLWRACGLSLGATDDAVAEDPGGPEDALSAQLRKRFLARQQARAERQMTAAERQQARLRRARAAAQAAVAARGVRVATPDEEEEPANPLPAAAPSDTPSPGVTDDTAAAPPAVEPVPEPVPAIPPPAPYTDYVPPGLDILDAATEAEVAVSPEEVTGKKGVIQQTLDNFGIDAEVTGAVSGPRVTLFEITPAPGVKVEAVSAIGNNLAMDLAAESLRILAPVPGQRVVGIEVPNQCPAVVRLRSLLEPPSAARDQAQIPLPVGRDIRGGNVFLDLARAPHLLIAGATGSGKSVCMNAMLVSLLLRFSPADLKLILIDPKVVEFAVYRDLPHLIAPVISDPKQVVPALRWVVAEMQWRYTVLAKVGVRHLEGFNKRQPGAQELDDAGNPIPARLPFLVVVIDELADIMLTVGDEVEELLARIAQLSRAGGIHTIIATQRPSVNVITGIIKANYPTRIAFQVVSQVDSRTILDGKGAETLLGRGDLLFKPPTGSRLARVQSPMVADEEIARVVRRAAEQAPAQLRPEILQPQQAVLPGLEAAAGGPPAADGNQEGDEALVQQAIEVIRRDRRATTSYVQRRLRIGYNKAAMIMELLEQRGLVGPQIGAAPREIFLDEEG
ncbi:MAG: DNA translocase FtsK [Lentisphaeria bacterium]